MSVGSIIEQTVRTALPLLFAASGGVIAERAGIVSFALEGYMLTGAFTAVVGTSLTGSAWVGLAAGIAGGLVLGSLHALGSIRFRANQIVMGIALNLLAIGSTRLFLKLVFKSSSNSSRVVGFGEGASPLNPLLWMGLAAIPVVAWVIGRTAFGLRVRAVGEHPDAAESLGVPVARVRTVAVLTSSGLAAIGGVYLALDQHQFTDTMTTGRGFTALAAVILGGWRPVWAGAACLFLAGADALGTQLQGLQFFPSQLLTALPQLLTILVLLVRVGDLITKSGPPSALGR